MPKALRAERRPLISKVPRVAGGYLSPPLPDSHVLVWLARAAASHTGFTAGHHQVLTDPALAKFRDTLERLHRNARGIHAKHDAPAAPTVTKVRDEINDIAAQRNAALAELADALRPTDVDTLAEAIANGDRAVMQTIARALTRKDEKDYKRLVNRVS